MMDSSCSTFNSLYGKGTTYPSIPDTVLVLGQRRRLRALDVARGHVARMLLGGPGLPPDPVGLARLLVVHALELDLVVHLVRGVPQLLG